MNAYHKSNKGFLSSPVAITIVLGFLGGDALGQQQSPGFTIKSGESVFSLRNVPNDAGGLGAFADFNVGGPGNPDHIFQSWWWYRLPGQARESTINAATPKWTVSLGGQLAESTFALAPNVTANMGWFISTFTNSGRGRIDTSLDVENKGGEAITISFFHYLDADLAGTVGDDAANKLNVFPPEIRLTDPGAWEGRYFQKGALPDLTGILAGSFPTLRSRLRDDQIDNLDKNKNTGLPFESGDWTGVFQWDLTIPAGKKAGITAGFSVVNVSEPTTLVLIIVGMLSLFLTDSLRRKSGSMVSLVNAIRS